MKLKKKVCRQIRKEVSLILAMAMIFSGSTQVFAGTSGFEDVKNHWAQNSIERLAEAKVLGGYSNQTFRPNNDVSRAELAACIAKIFGLLNEDAQKVYTDVKSDGWYADAINKVMTSGLMNDYNSQFRPNQMATREEAAFALAAAYRLSEGTKQAKFKDQDQIADWALDAVQVLSSQGYLAGSAGNMAPKGQLKRAELAALIDKITGTIITKPGTYSLKDLKGNVLIKSPGVILKDTSVEGSIYLAQGIGEGKVELENVQVKGTLFVEGGGESGLTLKGCTINQMLVDKYNNKITVTGDQSTTISESMLQSAVEVKGPLKIIKANISSNGVSIETAPEKVEIRSADVSAVIAGKKTEAAKVNPAITPAGGSGSSGGSSGGGGGSNPGTGTETPDEKWVLTWQDEFNGSSLDLTKWGYQYGTGSDHGLTDWGNNEAQYYTSENVSLKDGMLVIKAQKEARGGKEYTSSRIWTFPTFATKYGKIEAAISLPIGEGLWPAFWMMPKDARYGAWAASGEIDIMEARGRIPNQVDGTIHYGKQWPNNLSQGAHYTFPEGQDITGLHTYAIEWEPGEIRWYVNGKLYNTAKNWLSQGTDEPAAYPYPAPFNEEFYILLNLAVGGHYDGGRLPKDSDFPAEMKVDYVRVYQLKSGYNENIQRPVLEPEDYPAGMKQAVDGNYITDADIQAPYITPDPLSTSGWNYLNNAEGNGTVTQEGGAAKVTIANQGSQPYSIQLVQNIPVVKGHYYKVSFDAKSSAERLITAQIGAGGDRGWAKYSNAFAANLADEWQSFEYYFQMGYDTNTLGRFEINMGQATASVWLKNVKFEEITPSAYQSILENSSKDPLANGNHVYNGEFNLGDNRLAYWDTKTSNASVNFSVKDEVIHAAIISAGTEYEDILLYQNGIQLINGEDYRLIFKAKGDEARKLKVKLTSKDKAKTYAEEEINIGSSLQTYSFDFTMRESSDNLTQLQFALGGEKVNVQLDGIKLIRTTNNSINYAEIAYPLQNGDFAADYERWNRFTDSGGTAVFSMEGAEKAAAVNVTNVGTSNWNVMLMNENLKMEKGMRYELSFDVWGVQRDIEVKLENAGYHNYLEGVTPDSIGVTGSKQTYKYEFTMPAAETAALKFILGNTKSAATGTVFIDNVELKVKDAPVKKPALLLADIDNNYVGEAIQLRVFNREDWKDSIEEVLVNGSALDAGLYSMVGDELVIDAAAFNVEGSYRILVKAAGYANTRCTQNILGNNGLIITNGTFDTNTDGWEVLKIDGSDADVSAIDGEMRINFTNYAGWEKWSTMIHQNTIQLEAGKTYELKFDARSTVDREAWLEMSNMAPQVLNLTTTGQTFTFEFVAASTISNGALKFLLGTDNLDGALFVKNQSVYLDNISITEK